jgi:hypothetical protein
MEFHRRARMFRSPGLNKHTQAHWYPSNQCSKATNKVACFGTKACPLECRLGSFLGCAPKQGSKRPPPKLCPHHRNSPTKHPRSMKPKPTNATTCNALVAPKHTWNSTAEPACFSPRTEPKHTQAHWHPFNQCSRATNKIACLGT